MSSNGPSAEDAEGAEAATGDLVYTYLVTLHNGNELRRLAHEAPMDLWAIWAQARKEDGIMVWADEAATEARQIASIESDEGGEDEDEDEGGDEEEGEGDESR